MSFPCVFSFAEYTLHHAVQVEVGFGWFDGHGRCDPFWVSPRSQSTASSASASSSSSSSSSSPAPSQLFVTRAGQRVLFDFSCAHRAFCDTLVELTVGDGADDDGDAERTAAAIDEDAFVDAAHEMQRVRAAQVLCRDSVQHLQTWHAVDAASERARTRDADSVWMAS